MTDDTTTKGPGEQARPRWAWCCTFEGCPKTSEWPFLDGWAEIVADPGLPDGFYCPEHREAIEAIEWRPILGDDPEREYETPYTDAEAETLHRCNEGEPVSESDLLQLLSTDIRLIAWRVEKIAKIATPLTNDEELWAWLNDLRGDVTSVKWRCRRGLAAKDRAAG